MPVKRNTKNIIFSLVIAVLLSIFILPSWAQYFRPQWLLMVLIYWALFSDDKVGVFVAWCFGVLLDLLQGSILCEHAIGMVIVIYIVLKLQRQIRMFPVWQQAGAVLILNLLYLGIIFWIQSVVSKAPTSWMFWFSAFTTALLWPWLVAILNSRQRRIEAL